MKTTKIFVIGNWSLVIGIILLLLANTVQAVNYKNSYKAGRVAISGQQSVISIQTTAPAVGFQSTSAYSGQWESTSTTPMLNSDGSVNSDAYMSSAPKYAPGIRRNPTHPGTPDEEEDEGEQQPIGDGLWILLFLVFAYAIYNKVFRKPEQPQKQ